MGHISSTCCLPVDVFEGAGGDLIILQEWPDLKGETFVRIFIDMDEAERLCAQIMAVAKVARSK